MPELSTAGVFLFLPFLQVALIKLLFSPSYSPISAIIPAKQGTRASLWLRATLTPWRCHPGISPNPPHPQRVAGGGGKIRSKASHGTGPWGLGWSGRTVYAGYPRLLPLPIGLAADGGHVALDVALVALVPHQGVDFVAVLPPAEGPGVLHHGGIPAGNCGRQAKTGRDGGIRKVSGSSPETQGQRSS